nr:hypothetical protein WS71_02360 [Burkholderia mayonis]
MAIGPATFAKPAFESRARHRRRFHASLGLWEWEPGSEYRALHAPAPRRARRRAEIEFASPKHAACAKPLTHRADDLIVRRSLARAAIEKTHSSIATATHIARE